MLAPDDWENVICLSEVPRSSLHIFLEKILVSYHLLVRTGTSTQQINFQGRFHIKSEQH